MATQLERDFRRLAALESLAKDQKGTPEGDAAEAKAEAIRERHKALLAQSRPTYAPDPNPWEQYRAPPRPNPRTQGTQTQAPKPRRPRRRKRSKGDQKVEALGLGMLFGALLMGMAMLSELERDGGDGE